MIRIASSSAGTRTALTLLVGMAALGVFVALASAVMQLGLKEWDRGYDPILMLRYFWLYPDDAEVKKWAWRGGMGAGIVVFFALGAIFKRRVAVHGSARFASEAEIRRPVSGGDSLREPTGILLGQKDGKFLCLGGSEHVMLYAPTRSGKGVSCAIPNLLNWPDSAIVLDVKQENFARTAGFRAAHGQEVYLFDPLDPEGRTARYNPLGYIDRTDVTQRLDELQKVATMLFPDPPKADPIWAQMARTGFIGVGCMVAETPDRPFTIGEIYRQLTIGDTKAYLRQTVEDRRASGSPLSDDDDARSNRTVDTPAAKAEARAADDKRQDRENAISPSMSREAGHGADTRAKLPENEAKHEASPPTNVPKARKAKASLEVGDVPEEIAERYFTEARGKGQGYYPDAQTKEAAFHDTGNKLDTSKNPSLLDARVSGSAVSG